MSKNINKTRNSKRRIRRRHILSVTALVLLLSIGIVALLALGEAIEGEVAPQAQAQMVSVNFYFRDTDGHWGSEQRQLEADDDITVIIGAVLEGLLEGPQTAAFLPSIPEGVSIEGARLRTAVENTLRITFSQSFAYIDPIEIIDVTSSLVYTLTELEFISQLEFFIGEEPMLDGDGDEFGFRSRENTALEEIISPIVVLTETIILYFADEHMMGLVAEERTIEIERTIAQIPLEDTVRFILDALIEGPQEPGLYAAIPAGTVFTVGEHMGDTITVSFTQDFYEHLSGSGFTMEEMMIFSLVNTLTERAEIRRVHIFIDGETIQPDEEGNLHMDLSRPIDRDESLILGYQGE